jgi:hypothetical protein
MVLFIILVILGGVSLVIYRLTFIEREGEQPIVATVINFVLTFDNVLTLSGIFYRIKKSMSCSTNLLVITTYYRRL